MHWDRMVTAEAIASCQTLGGDASETGPLAPDAAHAGRERAQQGDDAALEVNPARRADQPAKAQAQKAAQEGGMQVFQR